MKLVTYRRTSQSEERLGALLSGDTILDLKQADESAGGGWSAAFESMQTLIEAGEAALSRARTILAAAAPGARVPLDQATLLAPLPRPVQMRDCLCFEAHLINAIDGRNAVAGVSRTPAQQKRIDLFRTRPFWYKCNRFAVAGTGVDVKWPAYSTSMDYELEMAVVISRKGVDIPKEDASSYIFGYSIFNDFSARDTQNDEMAALGPAKAKDFDNANILGPCIVTADEFDPRNARMISRINGEVQNEGNSSTMYWSFEELIAFISQSETLHAGEILCSGTVGGGCGLEHGHLLISGDEVELEIEGIGVIRNRVIAS